VRYAALLSCGTFKASRILTRHLFRNPVHDYKNIVVSCLVKLFPYDCLEALIPPNSVPIRERYFLAPGEIVRISHLGSPSSAPVSRTGIMVCNPFERIYLTTTRCKRQLNRAYERDQAFHTEKAADIRLRRCQQLDRRLAGRENGRLEVSAHDRG